MGKKSFRRLQNIALKQPDHLNYILYVDLLISSEKQKARPGWSERVRALQKFWKHAKILEIVIHSDDPGDYYNKYFFLY